MVWQGQTRLVEACRAFLGVEVCHIFVSFHVRSDKVIWRLPGRRRNWPLFWHFSGPFLEAFIRRISMKMAAEKSGKPLPERLSQPSSVTHFLLPLWAMNPSHPQPEEANGCRGGTKSRRCGYAQLSATTESSAEFSVFSQDGKRRTPTKNSTTLNILVLWK